MGTNPPAADFVFGNLKRQMQAMGDGSMNSGGAGNRDARPLTAEQIRAEIDSGRTGDKVAGTDPSAAPLGTDDEAGGTPGLTGRLAEASHSSRSGSSSPYPPPGEQPPPRKSAPALWLIALGVAVVGWVAVMVAV